MSATQRIRRAMMPDHLMAPLIGQHRNPRGLVTPERNKGNALNQRLNQANQRIARLRAALAEHDPVAAETL